MRHSLFIGRLCARGSIGIGDVFARWTYAVGRARPSKVACESPSSASPVAIARWVGALCLLGAAGAAVSNLASAQVTSGITVSPNPVQTVAQFAESGGQAYEGDAGVVTVTIGPNTTFIAGRPLRFEECNLDPTSQSDCDGNTVQTTDAVTGKTVTPGADGSVTFKMDLWDPAHRERLDHARRERP